MKLIHVTRLSSIESIRKNGLLIEPKTSDDTKDGYLRTHRPKNLPAIVDLTRCLYFAPANSAYGFRDHPFILGSSVQVLSRNLDQDKIWTAPAVESFELSKMMLRTRQELRDELVHSNEFKELCISYWKKFAPFSVYRAKYGHVEYVKDISQNVEVLYFGNIPPDKIMFRVKENRGLLYNLGDWLMNG